jgi:hypothetical protein
MIKEYFIQAFLIGHHDSAPIKHGDHQKKLKKQFKDNFIYDGKSNEFADFLRGSYKPRLSHRRKSRKGKK